MHEQDVAEVLLPLEYSSDPKKHNVWDQLEHLDSNKT